MVEFSLWEYLIGAIILIWGVLTGNLFGAIIFLIIVFSLAYFIKVKQKQGVPQWRVLIFIFVVIIILVIVGVIISAFLL